MNKMAAPPAYLEGVKVSLHSLLVHALGAAAVVSIILRPCVKNTADLSETLPGFELTEAKGRDCEEVSQFPTGRHVDPT
jgi:hypothetical protein